MRSATFCDEAFGSRAGLHAARAASGCGCGESSSDRANHGQEWIVRLLPLFISLPRLDSWPLERRLLSPRGAHGMLHSMPFETFKRQRLAPDKDPLITIQKKGIFSLNQVAYEALGKPEAVELLYDREASRIGLRKVNGSVQHSYRVRQFGTGATWLVSGTAFAKYYEIDLSVPVRYTARVDNDMLVIDLKGGGVQVESARRARS
jgi:hypothetical protein